MAIIQLTRSLFIFCLAGLVAGCTALAGASADTHSFDATAESSVRIVLASDVQWEALNPARGESSPRAGTLWGDRDGEQPTGFLARFVDGFSSPPHIHNVSYRAVVIDGGIHNDDPDAASMWMGNGSFWTQPAGETHVTAARGTTNMALVEIDRGPYLVRPPEQAFDSGERPVNLDVSNIVWLPLMQQGGHAGGAEVAYLWGNVGAGSWNGSFVKLPPGFEGVLATEGDVVHSVVIRGAVNYWRDDILILTPGSYFGARSPTEHRVASGAGEASIIYIRTNGRYHLRPVTKGELQK